MTNAKLNIITREEANERFAAEEKSGRYYIEYAGCDDVNGLLYYFYRDGRNGYEFAVRQTRTVHMGFNSNDEGKVEEFIEIVEREGECLASWGVTGRTMHQYLAQQLADSLPQYDWEIGYNYHCKATKK